MKNEFSVIKISESPLFNNDNDINIKRYKHDIEEYSNILNQATKDKIAFIIEGCEPTEQELIKIKKILDEKGAVKVFRKRKKIIGEKYYIKPSIFHTISVSKIDDDETKEIKYTSCKYIEELINKNN